jgi:hypothetical protein
MTRRAMNLSACDPGISSGGLVSIDPSDGDRVHLSRSLGPSTAERRAATATAARILEMHLEKGWGDSEFLVADLLAQDWRQKFRSGLDEIELLRGPIDWFAIESFVDFHSKAKQMLRDRWKTPLVIGYALAELRARGITPESGRLIFQNASVLGNYGDDLADLKSRVKPYPDGVVVPGDSLIGSDHEASALMHARELSHQLAGEGSSASRSLPVLVAT